ncbi:MAG TPA: type II toxin-antitoxin system VapC family toxin [Roseiarcus sp.]|jgi:predicted nucleic acid-binding protein
MPFVADASIVAAWLLPDEDDPLSRAALQALRRDKVIAPAILWFEVRNVLIVSERRGRLDEERTNTAISILNRLPIEIDGAPNDMQAIRLARRHRLSVYDACYLELTLRTELPLATRDARLQNAAIEENAPLFK